MAATLNPEAVKFVFLVEASLEYRRR